MGGFGSGRPRSRAHVEDSLVLDLPKLIGDGMVRPGCWSGSIAWHSTATGEAAGSVSYIATMDPTTAAGTIRVFYTLPNGEGARRPIADTIALEGRPQPFGGLIWYLRCPLSARRCRKLFLPPGARRFAARQVHRIPYRSQSEAPHERALSQAHKIRRRLGGTGAIGGLVERPAGMHRTTFARVVDRLDHYEDICDDYMMRALVRL